LQALFAIDAFKAHGVRNRALLSVAAWIWTSMRGCWHDCCPAAVFTIGRSSVGIIRLLQLTLVGRLPAVIWSVYARNQHSTEQKIA
jgi:hypothetical protein